ncbi:C1q-like domain-containing protein [Dyadobacter sp. 3J3]|uniref:C1q-like domain-containing protein n=1 Tax=Dyadobacter sp. 3J3 TaxID=2606600 RepID=UPI001356BA6C|nr:hypothetical protein [Dyadobacter sp. 3J3]
METKHLLPVLCGFASIFLTSSAFSQVKIGTNPTTINANSNLEVEGTNNKKVIVHRNDGTVVIENTPSGKITDSLLTVDPSGNVRMKSVESLRTVTQISPYIRLSGSVNYNTRQPLNAFTIKSMSVDLNNDMAYNAVTGEITILKPGIYFFSVVTTGHVDLGATATQNDHCTYFIVNNVSEQQVCGRSARFAPTASNSGIRALAVNDKVIVKLTTASNIDSTGIYSVRINMFKLSEKAN